MIGVGGAGGGGCGRNAAATGCGGGGGGSGAQTTAMIPAQFVPDTLYVQAGFGGVGGAVASANGTAGIATYVAIEPSTTLTANMLFLVANGGGGGGGGGGVSGLAGTAGTVSTIANMCLAGRGVYNFLAGQAGSTGRITAVGDSLTPQANGLMVTGGTGGGGSNGVNAAFAGGAVSAITGTLGTDFFPLPISGGIAGTNAPSSGGAGRSGFVSRNLLFNFGGTGGGGAVQNASSIPGAGGDGAPGCGGGGSGGSNITSVTVRPGGYGGPGFVIIISW